MKAWAIKLGSGGRCVPFCERQGIVGIGWKSVDPGILARGSRNDIWAHVAEACSWYGGNGRAIGAAAGQLYRFTRECREHDFIVYYDPPGKLVRIGRVLSGAHFRDFALDEDVDIWHYRRVELAPKAIPILDFYGGLKGGLLGPRMSFWEVRDAEAVAALFRGEKPHVNRASDPDLEQAYAKLRDLVVRRAETLTDHDWEWLIVDYLKAQGAHVDERNVGGSRPIIDAEAVFDRGELGEEIWRVQVKHVKNQRVDWSMIEEDYRHVGEARFCYVSVFGFTDDARLHADEEGIVLLEAGDFTRFLMSGKLRPRLIEKLQLPFGK